MNPTKIMNEQQYVIHDIRGQICPSSLLTSLQQVNSLKKRLNSGEIILSIQTDHRDATATIPGTMEKMGYAVSVKKGKGYYTILISRKELL